MACPAQNRAEDDAILLSIPRSPPALAPRVDDVCALRRAWSLLRQRRNQCLKQAEIVELVEIAHDVGRDTIRYSGLREPLTCFQIVQVTARGARDAGTCRGEKFALLFTWYVEQKEDEFSADVTSL